MTEMSNVSFKDDQSQLPRKYSIKRRIITSLILLFVICLGIFLYRAIQEAQNAAIDCRCQSRLNQLQLALCNYHDAHGHFPPAYIADKDGKPMHSWRVLILPFMEEQDLYKAYDFNEPWNGPHNSKMADKMPEIFHMDSEPPSNRMTNIVAITGPGTAFPGSLSTRKEEFIDGLDNTILLAEIANSNINWLEPRDLRVDEMSFVANDRSKPSICTSRSKGPYVVFADSIRAHRISPSLFPEALKALITIAGGEKMYIAETHGVGLTSPNPSPATDANLKALQDPGEDLSLWLDRSDITDVGISNLASLTHLSELHLRSTPITDNGLLYLTSLPKIYWLDLSSTSVTDLGLEHLKRLQKLSYLDLESTKVTTNGVSRLLTSLPKITIILSKGMVSPYGLELNGSAITDADVENFREHKDFGYIHLDQTSITDSSMHYFGTNIGLYRLHLSGAGITDEGLRFLTDLQKLNDLDLAHTKITDEGLKYLEGLTKLDSLYLADTQITDSAIKYLKNMPHLRVIDINLTKVTDDGINELKKTFPNLRIIK